MSDLNLITIKSIVISIDIEVIQLCDVHIMVIIHILVVIVILLLAKLFNTGTLLARSIIVAIVGRSVSIITTSWESSTSIILRSVIMKWTFTRVVAVIRIASEGRGAVSMSILKVCYCTSLHIHLRYLP